MNLKTLPFLLLCLLLVCCKKEEDNRLRTVEYKVLGLGYSTIVTLPDGSEANLGAIDNVVYHDMQVKKGTHVKVRVTGQYNDANFNAYIIVDGMQLAHAYGDGTETVVAEGTVK